MNWLEIVLSVFFGVAVLQILFVCYKKYKGIYHEYVIENIVVLQIITLLGCILLAFGLGLYRVEIPEGYDQEFQLVSLANETQISGSVSGSMLGFRGNMSSYTGCRFVTKDTNGEIIVRDIPVSKIVFYETKDKPKAIKHLRTFHYPFAIGEKSNKSMNWSYDYTQTWKIYIPEDSVKYYINFN